MMPEERFNEAMERIETYISEDGQETGTVSGQMVIHALQMMRDEYAAARTAVAEAETVAQEAGKSSAMLSEQLARAEQRQAEAVAAEREACWKIAKNLAENHDFYDGPYDVGCKIADAIRARGGGDDL